jgi:hypothetical protein
LAFLPAVLMSLWVVEACLLVSVCSSEVEYLKGVVYPTVLDWDQLWEYCWG